MTKPDTVVALYARVSTDKQQDNQMARLREVAESRGYTIYGEYFDIASGQNARRPQLDLMLAAAKQHKIDRIMATKIDRVARSVVNLYNLMEDLQRWGVSIEMIDQPIDTSTSSGKFTLAVIGAVAEFERELISDRTKDGLKRAKAQGRQPGRKKRELTPYQKDKIKQIIAENPGISDNELASNFEGISRNTLIRLAREEGLIQ